MTLRPTALRVARLLETGLKQHPSSGGSGETPAPSSSHQTPLLRRTAQADANLSGSGRAGKEVVKATWPAAKSPEQSDHVPVDLIPTGQKGRPTFPIHPWRTADPQRDMLSLDFLW